MSSHPAITYFLIALCVVVFILSFALEHRIFSQRCPRLARFAWVIQIFALVGAYIVLRPGQSTGSMALVQTSLAQGKPVLLEFYSNY